MAGPKFVYIARKVGDHAYKSVSAVDKENGWLFGKFASQYSNQNNWSNKNSGARIYGIGSDGRVTSFKEKRRETGEIIAKMPVEPEAEMPKMPAAKKKDESPADPAKPDEKKPDEKKPDEKKPDAPAPAKADAPAKPEEKKPEEKK